MASAHEVLHDARGLLIDLDGTLVDSTAAVRRAWEGFAARQGLDAEMVIRTAHGKPSGETVRRLARAADVDHEARAVEEAEVGDTAGVVALPGARAALAAPDRRIALVTSCSTALAHARLRAAGLSMPPVDVTSDDVAHGKPHPEPFRLGAERLGLEPRECLAFEDAPAGIAAARQAGAAVIALRTTHAEAELAGADAVIDDLSELFGGR